MPAAIFNGANVKILKDNLKGKSGWRLVGAGTYDYTLPTLSGNDTIVTQSKPIFTEKLEMVQSTGGAPTGTTSGSLYFKSDGLLYKYFYGGTEQVVGGSPYLGTDWIIRTNAQSIGEDITVPSTTNGMTVGPVTISTGYTVTVVGYWSIV